MDVRLWRPWLRHRLIRQLNVLRKDLWHGHGANPLKPISCTRRTLRCAGHAAASRRIHLLFGGLFRHKNPKGYWKSEFFGRRHDKLQTIHAIPTAFPSIIIGSRVKPNCSNLSNVMRCHVTHIVYTLFIQSFVHKCWKVLSKARVKLDPYKWLRRG